MFGPTQLLNAAAQREELAVPGSSLVIERNISVLLQPQPYLSESPKPRDINPLQLQRQTASDGKKMWIV